MSAVRNLRNAFLTGVLLLLPLGVTYVVAAFLLESVGRPASQIFFGFIDAPWREYLVVDVGLKVLALLVVVMVVTALGFFSRYVAGRLVINLVERVFERLPFINTVYRTVKQIVDTIRKQQESVFQRVVLLEYPRRDCWAVGFLTNRAQGEPQARTGSTLVNVFVPTTPNPTSGFLLMVPEHDVIVMEMTVAEGMKLIISGGAVTPPYRPSKSAAPQPPAAPARPGLEAD